MNPRKFHHLSSAPVPAPDTPGAMLRRIIVIAGTLLDETKRQAREILDRAEASPPLAAPALDHALRVVDKGTGRARVILKEYGKGSRGRALAEEVSRLATVVDKHRASALSVLKEGRERYRERERSPRVVPDRGRFPGDNPEEGGKHHPIGDPCRH
jgi:hypothetical protein